MHTGNRDCCSYYHGYSPGCAVVYVPMVWVPAPQACCESITVPRDLDADAVNATQQGLVGGSDTVSLTLEYLVEADAASPSVTLNTTSDSVTASWSDATPPVGYQVREALLSVKAGTKLELKVNNLTARLRWCERVCC